MGKPAEDALSRLGLFAASLINPLLDKVSGGGDGRVVQVFTEEALNILQFIGVFLAGDSDSLNVAIAVLPQFMAGADRGQAPSVLVASLDATPEVL